MARKKPTASADVAAPPAKKQKQASYTSVEDECLTRQWCKATLNEVRGNYQDEGKYWSKVAECYNQAMSVQKFPYRSIDSLQARWRKLNHNCTKFNGIYMQLKRLQKSGFTEDDYVNEAKKLYQSEVHSVFNSIGCWMIIKDHPKWAIGVTSIREIVNITDDTSLITEDAANSNSNSNPPSSSKSSTAKSTGLSGKVLGSGERPCGQKQAKAAVKAEVQIQSVNEMNAYSLKKRAEAHADAITFNVMGRLGSDNPIAKEWYQLKAMEALNELKAKLEKPKKMEQKVLKDLLAEAPSKEESISKEAPSQEESISAEVNIQEEDLNVLVEDSPEKENDENEEETEDCCAGELCDFGRNHPDFKMNITCYDCKKNVIATVVLVCSIKHNVSSVIKMK